MKQFETGRLMSIQLTPGTADNYTGEINRDGTEIPETLTFNVNDATLSALAKKDRVLYTVDNSTGEYIVSAISKAPGTAKVRVRIESSMATDQMLPLINALVKDLDGTPSLPIRLVWHAEGDGADMLVIRGKKTKGTLTPTQQDGFIKILTQLGGEAAKDGKPIGHWVMHKPHDDSI